MKLIFKIVKYLPESEQIIVKFARQHAPKPIDEYSPVSIDCKNIDKTDYESFVYSIFKYGVMNILNQEDQEPILSENFSDKVIESIVFEDQINRVIEVDSKELEMEGERVNKIKLD